MSTATLDARALERLLRNQRGLITTSQARGVGMSQDSLERRTHDRYAPWRRVLPRVYAAFTHPLTPWHRAKAALLYAGGQSIVTGLAVLDALGVRYLPAFWIIDMLVPHTTQPRSRDFVRIQQTKRLPTYSIVGGLRVAPAARAAADAARRFENHPDPVRRQANYRAVITLVTGVVQRRLATLEDIAAELAAGPRRGTALLARAVAAAGDGARSAAEATALALFRAAGLPEPLVNLSVVLPSGVVRCPDFRWGRLIVEIDSKEWHLLSPDSWQATQRRRRELQAAGYEVLVVTPHDLEHEPERVIAAIRAALARLSAA